MHKILPPVCLVTALAMLVAAFTLWAVEPPQESVELHAARVSGDEAYEEALENQLTRRQFARKALIGCLFAGAGFMFVVAFFAM